MDSGRLSCFGQLRERGIISRAPYENFVKTLWMKKNRKDGEERERVSRDHLTCSFDYYFSLRIERNDDHNHRKERTDD